MRDLSYLIDDFDPQPSGSTLPDLISPAWIVSTATPYADSLRDFISPDEISRAFKRHLSRKEISSEDRKFGREFKNALYRLRQSVHDISTVDIVETWAKVSQQAPLTVESAPRRFPFLQGIIQELPAKIRGGALSELILNYNEEIVVEIATRLLLQNCLGGAAVLRIGNALLSHAPDIPSDTSTTKTFANLAAERLVDCLGSNRDNPESFQAVLYAILDLSSHSEEFANEFKKQLPDPFSFNQNDFGFSIVSTRRMLTASLLCEMDRFGLLTQGDARTLNEILEKYANAQVTSKKDGNSVQNRIIQTLWTLPMSTQHQLLEHLLTPESVRSAVGRTDRFNLREEFGIPAAAELGRGMSSQDVFQFLQQSSATGVFAALNLCALSTHPEHAHSDFPTEFRSMLANPSSEDVTRFIRPVLGYVFYTEPEQGFSFIIDMVSDLIDLNREEISPEAKRELLVKTIKQISTFLRNDFFDLGQNKDDHAHWFTSVSERFFATGFTIAEQALAPLDTVYQLLDAVDVISSVKYQEGVRHLTEELTQKLTCWGLDDKSGIDVFPSPFFPWIYRYSVFLHDEQLRDISNAMKFATSKLHALAMYESPEASLIQTAASSLVDTHATLSLRHTYFYQHGAHRAILELADELLTKRDLVVPNDSVRKIQAVSEVDNQRDWVKTVLMTRVNDILCAEPTSIPGALLRLTEASLRGMKISSSDYIRGCLDALVTRGEFLLNQFSDQSKLTPDEMSKQPDFVRNDPLDQLDAEQLQRRIARTIDGLLVKWPKETIYILHQQNFPQWVLSKFSEVMSVDAKKFWQSLIDK